MNRTTADTPLSNSYCRTQKTAGQRANNNPDGVPVQKPNTSNHDCQGHGRRTKRAVRKRAVGASQESRRELEPTNGIGPHLIQPDDVHPTADHETRVRSASTAHIGVQFQGEVVSPICQVMLVDIIPTLVPQNILNEKSLEWSSLLAMPEKMATGLAKCKNQYVRNEISKAYLIIEYDSHTSGFLLFLTLSSCRSLLVSLSSFFTVVTRYQRQDIECQHNQNF